MHYKIKFTLFIIVLFLSLFHIAIDARDLPKPKLMLANIYHKGINLDKYWVSEKYDGVRAIWNGEQLVSRGGNIYHAPKWFIKDFPKTKLDGELWIERQGFELLISTVRDDIPDDKAWHKVKFMVFDLPDSPLIFSKRIKQIKRLIDALKIPWLQPVKQWKASSHHELMKQLQRVTKAGAEGLMLHRGTSLYKGKRNNDLLKVKLYDDAEALVIKHLPGKGKYQNMMGALLVKMPSGKTFKIGTGFSDHERKYPPAIGKWVTYQYHGLTKKGLPRFASFLRIRAQN